MSGNERCVLLVGGSHSVHVRVPARMIREAGYRIALADLQDAIDPEALGLFDAIYPLNDRTQRLLTRGRAMAGPGEPDYDLKLPEIEEPARLTSYAWRLTQGWLRAGRLLDAIRKEKPGIVYFQSMTAGGMTAYYLLKRMGWPPRGKRPGLLTHLWGYKPRFPGQRRREIRALKEFDFIHTSSPAVARMYREHFEVPPDRIAAYVRGISLRTFGPRPEAELLAARAEWGVPADKFVVIHNRHLHPMYRVDIAVDAVIDLARRGHDVFLILVRGSMRQAEYEAEMVGRMKAAGLGDRVALMPPILTADQMGVALRLARAAINCVPFDAFGVSILEAMYARAVPVVRNLESYVEFVKDGVTGFAVDGGPAEYADRIERLIRDPPLRDRMADAGAALVEAEGSEEVFRERTLRLIEKHWHTW